MEQIQRLAIIALVNLVVYYRTIFFGYVGDDVERSERKEPVFKNRIHGWWIRFIGLRHTNSMHAHIVSLLTHIACCCAIYLALGRNSVSFLTALLFSVNPINLQGSVWISGRNYVTASILTLCMWAFPILSWFFYGATSIFAVNAWFAPLAFLGTKHWYMVGIIPLIWIISQSNRQTLSRKVWETGGLKTTNTEMRAVKIEKLIPFVKTYLYYFVLAIFPHSISVEHNFLRGFGTNKTDNNKGYKIDQYFALGASLMLTVGFLSVVGILKGWTPISWGLFWFTINIAMWCNFVTIQQQIAERYMYLANIGMMFALANLIIGYPIIITAFIVGYIVRTWYVMDMYLNDDWAVEYSLKEIKNMHYMWLMRGVKKFMRRDHIGALIDFQEAYVHKSYDLKILFNLATTYFILGDVVQARKHLELAKQNVYDELGDTVKPAFEQLDAQIKIVEEAKAKGETQVQIDLSRVMVVK